MKNESGDSSGITIKNLATTIGLTVSDVLAKLAAVGLTLNSDDILTKEQIDFFLSHISENSKKLTVGKKKAQVHPENELKPQHQQRQASARSHLIEQNPRLQSKFGRQQVSVTIVRKKRHDFKVEDKVSESDTTPQSAKIVEKIESAKNINIGSIDEKILGEISKNAQQTASSEHKSKQPETVIETQKSGISSANVFNKNKTENVDRKASETVGKLKSAEERKQYTVIAPKSSSTAANTSADVSGNDNKRFKNISSPNFSSHAARSPDKKAKDTVPSYKDKAKQQLNRPNVKDASARKYSSGQNVVKRDKKDTGDGLNPLLKKNDLAEKWDHDTEALYKGDTRSVLAYLDSERSLSKKHQKKRLQQAADNELLNKQKAEVARAINKNIFIPEMIVVSDLAAKMSIKVADLIAFFLKSGMPVTINQIIDQETAIIIASDMGYNPKAINLNEKEEIFLDAIQSGVNIQNRPPIVTIMGHVDHGKTSLLDYIRKSKVVSKEAGGITQHIGAYHVVLDKGVITFLDTPGHSAFTAMRARGAQITDIVVLVVAADDGVMPQTLEAIQHAKSANVPIVVAINKMDKQGVDTEKIKTALASHGLIPEEWSGDTIYVPISAKTGFGIDDLLDSILVQAEVLNLQAPIDGTARGVIIESRLDKSLGPVITLLVRSGLLNNGDIVLAGAEYGKIRAIRDENSNKIDTAGPSIPVEIFGLSGVPTVGDECIVVKNEKEARDIALFRKGKFKENRSINQKNINKDEALSIMDDNQTEKKQLNVIIKCDVQGSCEAINQAISGLVSDLKMKDVTEVVLKIVMTGVGPINESDANLAIASNAFIMGFNVKPDLGAKFVMDKKYPDRMKTYDVIYDLLNDLKGLMTSLTAPKFIEKILGIAQVKDVFSSSKFGSIAGCIVLEGVIKRGKKAKVTRGKDTIVENADLNSLKRYKEDVAEVQKGIECGISVVGYEDIKAGDKIQIIELVPVASDSTISQ